MSTYSAQAFEKKILEKGLLSKDQYDRIKRRQLQTGQTFEELLSSETTASRDEIVKIKSELTGIPFVDPTKLSVSKDVLDLIPESTAKKFSVIPIKKTENSLSVVMADPEDLEIIDFLQRSTNLNIQTNISTPELIKLAIDREYSKSLGKDVSQAIQQATETSTAMKMKETLQNIDQAEEIIKVSPVAQIVSVILEYAVKSGASDIHIEPFETGTRIRYRIDGVLQAKFPLPKAMHNSIVARIKILANMQIDEHRKPLDGKFKVIFGDKKTDLRVSTLPTVFGEKVVIRLLKDEKDTFTFKDLGLWGRSLHAMEKALKETTGIILVTGPTGSGKTVTNATALAKLNTPRVNIVTLEDPVEIHIGGVNQVQINVAAGLTFATGLRSILRQDPNIIMVGEIRDKETARLAIQAALTGHLVLATLHTNSAAGAIPRLIDMGVENFLLASTLDISLAQRLSRRICKYCKEEYTPDPKVIEDIKKVLGDKLLQVGLGPSPFIENKDEDKKQKDQQDKANQSSQQDKTETQVSREIKLYRGKGCERCGTTGYKGRIALYEIMEVNESIRQLTLKNSSDEEIKKVAVDSGMITLVQDGYLKALWGITTIEEVLSVADK